MRDDFYWGYKVIFLTHEENEGVFYQKKSSGCWKDMLDWDTTTEWTVQLNAALDFSVSFVLGREWQL